MWTRIYSGPEETVARELYRGAKPKPGWTVALFKGIFSVEVKRGE